MAILEAGGTGFVDHNPVKARCRRRRGDLRGGAPADHALLLP